MGEPDQERQDPGTDPDNPGPRDSGPDPAAPDPGAPDPGTPEPAAPDPGVPEPPVESSSDAMTRRLLESLLASQGGPASSRRSRVAAGVIRVLIAEGAAAEVAGFLAPAPGQPAAFELTVEESVPADGGRASVQHFGADVETAVREALRAAARGASVGVRSVSGDVRRTVLRHSRTRPGALELVPADPDAYDGDPGACRAAVDGWHRAVAALTGPGPDAGPVTDTGPVADPGPVAAPQPSAPGVEIPAALSEATASLDLELDPAAIGAAVQRALADVTIEMDMSAVEQAVRSALADLSLDFDPAAVEAPVRRVVAQLLGLDEAGGEPAGRLARHADLAALARRADLAGLARIESKLDQLLAASTGPDRTAPPDAPGAGTTVPAEAAAGELVALRLQVEILLQTLAERLAAGTRSLEALADELADRDRTATVLAGELARRTDAALDRLAARLDGRPPLPPGPPGPPEASGQTPATRARRAGRRPAAPGPGS